MTELNAYLGRNWLEVFDELMAYAAKHGYEFNVLDPDFNTSNIDSNPKRLNVHTDRGGVITKFAMG